MMNTTRKQIVEYLMAYRYLKRIPELNSKYGRRFSGVTRERVYSYLTVSGDSCSNKVTVGEIKEALQHLRDDIELIIEEHTDRDFMPCGFSIKQEVTYLQDDDSFLNSIIRDLSVEYDTSASFLDVCSHDNVYNSFYYSAFSDFALVLSQKKLKMIHAIRNGEVVTREDIIENLLLRRYFLDWAGHLYIHKNAIPFRPDYHYNRIKHILNKITF